ncbi:autotransporter outer membrane beta-barrel domain-containing protein [Salmonella enterica subsp. enterica serovar Oranienburg]|nr:autotransporter outer membrane beta-barrel domain-containing protein [Salmonella enterica]EBV3722099.1 autotransporter outer membrane beta-barrel domain-containing protein [Salmonella enterica subsp. enterica serovar Oranienburg]EBV4574333.1 autotransporter outer membrane beta-barrel domain-containing protein [Salmonella enterica subsp. enterica serovar Oranienburg]EBY7703086.1 autotransporter outer membrane beta-barrel domain-containing protein [Salmonella enterica subsp. enterica serovar Or
MAVENKFKLNFIAASVLMGLSLSAVAAEAVQAETSTVTAKAKTLAEVVTAASKITDADGKKTGVAAKVDIASIAVTPKDGNVSTLAEVLKTTIGSNVGDSGGNSSKKKAYDDALAAKTKLTADQLKVVETYQNAKTAFDTAAKAFTASDFGAKSAGINKVYNEKLSALYGEAGGVLGHAWKIINGELDGTGKALDSSSSKPQAEIVLNSVGGSPFKTYTDSITELGNKINSLQAAAEAVLKAANSADTTSLDVDSAKIDKAVTAYKTYLKNYYEVAKLQSQQTAIEHYIQEKLPAFLKVVEANRKAAGNTDADATANKTKLDGLYTSFTSAVKDYKAASSDTDKAAKKVVVYTKLNALVTEAVKANVLKNDVPDGFKATDFQTALLSANALWKANEAALGDDTTNGAIKTLNDAKTLPNDDSVPDTLKGQKIESPDEARKRLSEYLTDLVKSANGKTGISEANQTALTGAIDGINSAHDTFTKAETAYKTALGELKVAETARSGLLADWIELNKQYSDAADAYNIANTSYATSSAAKIISDLDIARTAYGDNLGKVSSGIQSSLDAATEAYKAAVKTDGGTAKTQQEKNEALYTLIGQQKALTTAKLMMDTELLKLRTEDMAAQKDAITQAETGKSDAEQRYNAAVKEYLDAQKKFGADKTVDNELAVSAAEAKLLTFTQNGNGNASGKLTELYANGADFKGGFKLFKDLDTGVTKNSVLKNLSEAQNTLYVVGTRGNPLSGSNGSDIQKARIAVVEGMGKLVSLLPLSTAEEQIKFRQQYNESLTSLKETVVGDDAQSKRANAESITHYLGSLTPEQIATFNTASGQFNSVIVNVDDKGNVTGVKDKFTGKDLYTGSKDKPFTTTVLDIRALELGNGALADTNTITVGEAATKDKKATPVEVWARTAGTPATPAVKLSGDLRTVTAQLDENGKPMDGQIVRGADQIHLQNVNIHNSFTLADKVKMLADDVAALNQQAADKLALGQPAEGEVGVNKWLKGQNNLLNSKYNDLQLTGLQIDTSTVNPEFNLNSGSWENAAKTVIPADASILLDNLNITLQNDSVGGTSTAINLSGTGNHILATGGIFDAGSVTGDDSQANVLDISKSNNIVDFNGSTLKGDIRSGATGNKVNLMNSSLTGDAVSDTGSLTLNLDGSAWTGGAGPNSPDVSLSNNSVWNVKGYDFTAGEGDSPESSVNSLTLNGSNTLNLVNAEGKAQLGGRGFVGSKYGTVLSVDHDLVSDGKGVISVLAGTYSPDNLHSLTNTGLAGGYQFGGIYADGLATGGKYALFVESAGAEPYTIGGRLADGADATRAHEFVSYKTSENRPVTGKDGNTAVQTVKSDADFTSLSAPAELGVYQYAAEKVMDGVNNRTNIYYSSTGKLSNSAATVVSLAAAPVDVANLESDTLAKHMNSVRHGKDSGVWVSYFGGENRNTTAAGPEYTLKTNGVMLGADTLTENNWLAGVAVSSARSDMSVMNSSGDLNSYGAQFYMSRRYDSGVFVDSALQFNHFSNTAKARMTDGQQAKADFSGNSYGLEAKVGYAWNSEGFFAEPYVRAAARAFDGEHYALSNGMIVNSNDYKSMLGEVGADLGYQYDTSGGYVKPYLHLAALNEFADGNSVRVNNVSLDNSVKGAAFQAGLGAEVKVTDNLGGYAAFDYTKGDNTERPWQATVGVNYTW